MLKNSISVAFSILAGSIYMTSSLAEDGIVTFDAPLVKPATEELTPKQFENPAFKSKPVEQAPKQFQDPLFKPKPMEPTTHRTKN